MIPRFSWLSLHMVLTPSSMSILPAYLLCMPGSRVMAMHSTATNQRPFCLVHENSYMPSQSVSIPDSRVPLSQNSTVLGVTLDSTLSLNKHYFPQLSVSVFLHECIKTHSFHTKWRYSNSSRGYTCSVTSGLCKLFRLKLPLPISKSFREPKTRWHGLPSQISGPLHLSS